jgi:hypothetical protein
VYVTRPPSIEESHEFLFTAGDTVHLHGTIYNLGTEDAAGVEVTLTDLGDSTVLDRDTLGFEGLDRDGCVTDDATADFVWVTGSGDIGAHLLEIAAEDVGSEDEGDNSVRIPVLVEPRDYATEVRGDPWDMLEAESSPPGWMTNDIEAVSGDWVSSCWTDSVGGMYEGALDPETTSPHRAEISLAIPPDSSRWIDAGIYDMLGFGGAWYSPYLPEDAQCGMYVMWRDSEGDLHGWFSLDTSQGLLKNGWQEYREVRGIDLGEVDGAEGSWRGMIPELWIRVQTDLPDSVPGFQEIPIRLSWILLEESGD